MNAATLQTTGAPFDVDTALNEAGLNWEVRRQRVFIRASATDERMVRVEGQAAIVRDTPNGPHVFQVASNRYTPHQNRDLVQFFAEYADAAGARLSRLGSFDNGAQVWGQAEIPNGGFEVSPGDVVMGYLTIGSSHDGSISTVVNYSNYRIWCKNSFVAAIRDKRQRSVSIRHTREFNAAAREQAARVLGLAKEQHQEFAETARALHRVEFDERARLEFVTRLTNPKLLADVIAVSSPVPTDGAGALSAIIGDAERDTRVKRAHELTREDLTRVGSAVLSAIVNGAGAEPNTAWGAFNGATFYVDHERGRGGDAARSAAMFGAGAEFKRNALQIVRTMALAR